MLLALLLAWLALLNEAVTLSLMEQETEPAKEEAEPRKEKTIRVVLMDSSYESYYHPSVTVLTQGERKTYTPQSDALLEGPLILPEEEEGICVESLQRQEGAPVYQGTLEIHKREQGLVLVNELPLEEYLKAVVPSEMPSTYEKEALMAQAVCARTYACKQMEERRMKEYGGDVDDSVNFQVYGNIASRESTAQAVELTRGKVLCQDGMLIQAYYFSTSPGVTSTDEVWGATEAASYLKSVTCTFDQESPWSAWQVSIPWDVLKERAKNWLGEDALGATEAASYLKSVTCTFDQESPWSAWQVSIPWDVLKERAKNWLGEDALKTLEITRKNQSGAVTGLRIAGENQEHTLQEEYSIREFLSPKGISLTQKNGNTEEGGNLLPSAYFTMDVVPDTEVRIQGKGYGHGVGMSQNAANEMALEGYSYEEILRYFFNNVEICDYDSALD